MKGILIGLLACLLLAGTVLGCVKTPAADPTAETVPAPTAQPLNETTSEPTAEATAEPTPEPEPIDPFDAIDAAEIADSKHDWEDEYTARFNTHVLDTALITVHLEDNREYSDETLRTFAKTLAADVLRLGEYTGVTPRKITVYIAKRMLQNRPVLVGDHLFCTMDDMETGAYREALIGACFDLPLAWKQIGLSTVVFGNPDESGLADYYGNKAHANVASCAAVFYIPTVSDAETIAAARKTAASMTAFILETDGFDAFRSIADTAEILPAWAAHLGIEPPALIAGSAYAASMTAESDSRYLVTMQIGNKVFRVEEGAQFKTADKLYCFVCIFYYGADLLIAHMREDVPAVGEMAAARFEEPIEIYLFKPGRESSNLAQPKRIYIRDWTSSWHELTHTLLWTELKNIDFTWQMEAVAEYWSESVLQDIDPRKEYAGVDDLMKDSHEAPRAFYETFWNVYLNCKAKDPASKEEIRFGPAIYYTYGVMSLLSEEALLQPVSIAEVYGRRAGSKETDANALSYPEAYVLFRYLVDTYGVETVVTGYLNQTSLEELYGKSYPELYRDLLAYLTETYGAFFENE
ncbi:MAG: PT domain-containing protein [Clostridia bacterium]|nr:PT domain-containing protein [Clostridia bacterium]